MASKINIINTKTLVLGGNFTKSQPFATQTFVSIRDAQEPETFYRITEDNEVRLLENGDNRELE